MSRPEDAVHRRASSRLLVVRHRQSTWNAEHRWSGQADPPLSPGGRAEATELAAALRVIDFDAIVTSDLSRARGTGELIGAAIPGAVLVEDPRLREIDIPMWSGRTKAELHENDAEAYARWRSRAHEPPPGAEPWDQLKARLVEGLRSAAHQGQTVLVVTHAGALKALREALEVKEKIKRSRGLWVAQRGARLVAVSVVRLDDIQCRPDAAA